MAEKGIQPFLNLQKAFMFAAGICFILSYFSQGYVFYGAEIAGYSLLVIAIAMLNLRILKSLRENPSVPKNELMLYTIQASTPFWFIFGVLCYSINVIVSFKERIIEGKVADGFYVFNNILLVLYLLMTYLLYTGFSYVHTGVIISKLTSSLLYLYGVMALIGTIIVYIILKFYSTDG